MGKIIDADVIKRKLIAYGFSSLRMTVTELIDECEELPTMQSDKICDYCIHCAEDTIKYCMEDEYGNSCRFEGKRVIEVEE